MKGNKIFYVIIRRVHYCVVNVNFVGNANFKQHARKIMQDPLLLTYTIS